MSGAVFLESVAVLLAQMHSQEHQEEASFPDGRLLTPSRRAMPGPVGPFFLVPLCFSLL